MQMLPNTISNKIEAWIEQHSYKCFPCIMEVNRFSLIGENISIKISVMEPIISWKF